MNLHLKFVKLLLTAARQIRAIHQRVIDLRVLALGIVASSAAAHLPHHALLKFHVFLRVQHLRRILVRHVRRRLWLLIVRLGRSIVKLIL